MEESVIFSIRVVVVGGGIAGFSTAIGLRKKGFAVTVIERHPSCQTLGAPLRLGPNATRVLISYGMEDMLAPLDAEGRRSVIKRYDGSLLLETNVQDMRSSYGAPLWTLSRFQLQEKLLAHATTLGVEVMWDSKVDDIDLLKPSIQLQNGQVVDADLIVGADGIASTVRNKMLGPVKSISPLITFNIDVPMSLVKENPKTAFFLEEQGLWLGPHRLVAQMNDPNHRKVVNLGLASEKIEGGKEGHWLIPGDLKVLQEDFSVYGEPIQEMIKMCPPGNCYLWKLSELAELERWHSEDGKVVVVGDAAHAMIPYTGQGAGMAIEDSACLAECLGTITTKADIQNALATFEAIRKPRTQWAKIRGRFFSLPLYHLPDGPEQELRDKRFAGTAGGLANTKLEWTSEMLDEPPAPAEQGAHQLAVPYLYGHNVLEYTQRYFEKASATK